MTTLQDCPMSNIEKEADQIQQMFNLDEELTSLKMLATDTYDSLNWEGSFEEKYIRKFTLIKGKNGPTTFCL